jgi:hypothetical protein
MRTNIHVESITEKKAKNGMSFVTMQTNVGAVNCFDTAIVAAIRANIANDLIVEIDERNNYKNVTQFIGTATPTEKVTETNPTTKTYGNKAHITMLMSYVKDLVVAGKIETNDISMWCGAMLQIYKDMVKSDEKN